MNNTFSDQFAKEVSIAYSQSDLTMSDLAKEFNLNDSSLKLSAAKISDFIYHCIFFDIINPKVEYIIIEKIANGQLRHAKEKNPSISKSDWVYKKYMLVLKDKAEYEYYQFCLNQAENELKFFYFKSLLTQKLQHARSMNIEDFMSSEDERFYIPEPKEEDLIEEINQIDAEIKKYNLNKVNIEAKIVSIKRNMAKICGKYKI